MTVKHPKLHHENHHHPHLFNHGHHHNHQQQAEEELIPGLPDHIAYLILSKLPPFLIYSVSPTWRRYLYSPLSPPFLSMYALITPISSPETHHVNFSCFDPVSSKWTPLPPPPLPLLSRHPSFISRHLPIQAVVTSAYLVVVSATSHHLLPALPRPLLFNPITSNWGFGPPLSVPRRWCAAGSLSGCVYVASGVGSHFSSSTARAVEKWDPCIGSTKTSWAPCSALRDGRFSREAIDAVGWRGGLCVVNATMKEGVVYDAKTDTWLEMKEGMVAGWRVPVAVMAEEVVYVVDEEKGVLRRYEERTDCWVDVMEHERLRGALQMAAAGGRVCVACGGGAILVVDVTVAQVRTWVVEPPDGYKVVAVHILPRMSTPTP